MDGCSVGDNSIIGAGAIVTKDVPEYSVAVGMPAKVIKDRREKAE
jgi:Serine acetyltransferase